MGRVRISGSHFETAPQLGRQRRERVQDFLWKTTSLTSLDWDDIYNSREGWIPGEGCCLSCQWGIQKVQIRKSDPTFHWKVAQTSPRPAHEHLPRG